MATCSVDIVNLTSSRLLRKALPTYCTNAYSREDLEERRWGIWGRKGKHLRVFVHCLRLSQSVPVHSLKHLFALYMLSSTVIVIVNLQLHLQHTSGRNTSSFWCFWYCWLWYLEHYTPISYTYNNRISIKHYISPLMRTVRTITSLDP